MKRTVFLLSSWYSGATMLTMLLDRHPAVVSNGEAFPYNPRDRRHVCSCGKRLHECEFYRYAAAHMLDNPKLFLQEPLLDLPSPLRRLAMSPRFAGRVKRLMPRSNGGRPYCYDQPADPTGVFDRRHQTRRMLELLERCAGDSAGDE